MALLSVESDCLRSAGASIANTVRRCISGSCWYRQSAMHTDSRDSKVVLIAIIVRGRTNAAGIITSGASCLPMATTEAMLSEMQGRDLPLISLPTSLVASATGLICVRCALVTSSGCWQLYTQTVEDHTSWMHMPAACRIGLKLRTRALEWFGMGLSL